VGAVAASSHHGQAQVFVGMLRKVMEATTRITSLAFIILVAPTASGWSFGAERRPSHPWTPQEPAARLLWRARVVMFIIFLLGFFIDFFEICFIHVPILTPRPGHALRIRPTLAGVIIGVNLQTSFLTPPFCFALFYWRRVAPPEIKTTDIYRAWRRSSPCS